MPNYETDHKKKAETYGCDVLYSPILRYPIQTGQPITFGALAETFGLSSKAEYPTFNWSPYAYNRQKDVLLYGLALLGTVTGYYLRRVPAERSAQQAQRTAQGAQELLTSAQKELTTATSVANDATKESHRLQQAKDVLKTRTKRVLEMVQPVLAEAEQSRAKTPRATFAIEPETIVAVRHEIDGLLSQLQ